MVLQSNKHNKPKSGTLASIEKALTSKGLSGNGSERQDLGTRAGNRNRLGRFSRIFGVPGFHPECIAGNLGRLPVSRFYFASNFSKSFMIEKKPPSGGFSVFQHCRLVFVSLPTARGLCFPYQSESRKSIRFRCSIPFRL
jgi:hypothetical protein